MSSNENKLRLESVAIQNYKHFPRCVYNVGSGKIFGDSGEGKTNLLSAITSCFVNAGIDGKKTSPLPDDADAGWVKLMFTLNGEHQEIYRAWTRTATGVKSHSSMTQTIQKSLFLAIANPMYIFGLETADRHELLIDFKYFDYMGNIADELGADKSIDVVEFFKEYPQCTSIKQLRDLIKIFKTSIKDMSALKTTLEAQLEVLENVSNVDDLVQTLTEQLEETNKALTKSQRGLCATEQITSTLLKNAVDFINSKCCLTKFTEDGKITFSDKTIDRISSGERLECGLDIADAIASKSPLIPPTLIDNITSLGHFNVNIDLFPNLSQIISTSFAEVELCEFDGKQLHALDRSWTKVPPTMFRPEVEIQMIEIER